MFPYPCQDLFSLILIVASLLDVSWHLIVILTCTSLMIILRYKFLLNVWTNISPKQSLSRKPPHLFFLPHLGWTWHAPSWCQASQRSRVSRLSLVSKGYNLVWAQWQESPGTICQYVSSLCFCGSFQWLVDRGQSSLYSRRGVWLVRAMQGIKSYPLWLKVNDAFQGQQGGPGMQARKTLVR